MWLLLFKAIIDDPINTEYSFANLTEIIHSNILMARTAIYRANKQLLQERKRMLVSVPGQGYKLVDGMSQFSHAKLRHKKADKQIVLASFEAKNLNTSAMSQEQKAEWQGFLALNGSMLAVMRQQVRNMAAASEVTHSYTQDQFAKFEENMNMFQRKIEEINEKLESDKKGSGK